MYKGAHLDWTAKMKIPNHTWKVKHALLIVLIGGVTMLHSASAGSMQPEPTSSAPLVKLLERFADAWNRTTSTR
jgi:hypothetical protein